MDDLRFLTQQAIQSAKRRRAKLVSLTLSGGEPWMEGAVRRLLQESGFEAVKVQVQHLVGPLRLVEIEITRDSQEIIIHQD